MPGRPEPLAKDEYYHVFNRAITGLTIFPNSGYYHRFINTFKYYQVTGSKPRFSFYLRLPETQKKQVLANLNSDCLVDILSYCLMPNHFHFLFRQLSEDGVSDFIGLVANSFTRYFNTRNHRVGAIFQGRFKAVRIESEEQLIHVSRYIHLNPYSSGLVQKPSELENYSYSSFPDFIHPESHHNMKNNLVLQILRSPEKYKEFVFNQADAQRQMERIKHLTLDL
jgi:putative transposase